LTGIEPSEPPEPRHRRERRREPILIALILAVLAVSIVVVVVRTTGSGSHHQYPVGSRPATVETVTRVAKQTRAARIADIRALLHRRSAAIVDHNRAAFLATVDPAETGFWHSQEQMFTNLAQVKFATWSYSIGAGGISDLAELNHYGAPVWAPAQFALHYRIAGFDQTATDEPQYPTFVRRSGRWYLASLSDLSGRGDVSATDIWDYGQVYVVRRRGVLILGPSNEIGAMTELAGQAQESIQRVSAVWGPDWARRVVVIFPPTQREMALLTADHGDLNNIVAVTSAEVSATPGRPKPKGDRVTINPRNWSQVGPVGAIVTLTHEFTHVATRSVTGSQMPRWLVEGFANYVGFHDSGMEASTVAAELAKAVQAGHLPKQLPTDADFDGSSRDLSQAYEMGWLACRFIAHKYGQPTLVRFYREVGTSRHETTRAVADAMHHLLGLTLSQFTAGWRHYMRVQLTS
jgi:hypothetical protein